MYLPSTSHLTVLRSTRPRDNSEILWLWFVYLPYIRRDLNVFVLWVMVVADGKGGGKVVNTTDICTLNSIATQARKCGTCMQIRDEKIGSRDVCRQNHFQENLIPKAYVVRLKCTVWIFIPINDEQDLQIAVSLYC